MAFEPGSHHNNISSVSKNSPHPSCPPAAPGSHTALHRTRYPYPVTLSCMTRLTNPHAALLLAPWWLPADASAHGTALDHHLLLNLWIILPLTTLAHLILLIALIAPRPAPHPSQLSPLESLPPPPPPPLPP